MLDLAKTGIRSYAEQVAYERQHGRHAGRKEWLRSIIATGVTVKDCADVLGCSHSTLRKWAHRIGLSFNRAPKVTDAQIAESAEAGLTIPEVARKFEVHESTIRLRGDLLGVRFNVRGYTKPQRPARQTLSGLRKAMPGASVLDLMAEMARQENSALRAVGWEEDGA